MAPCLPFKRYRLGWTWLRAETGGFTLIETLLVIVIIGTLTTFAFPFLRKGQDQASVRSATDAIAGMHAMARAVAGQRARRTVLELGSGVMVIRSTHPVTGAVDSVGAVENMNERFMVTVASTRDSLVFDPRGLGTETSATYIYVQRGRIADTLRVTRLGRVLK